MKAKLGGAVTASGSNGINHAQPFRDFFVFSQIIDIKKRRGISMPSLIPAVQSTCHLDGAL
jgi:hypothetical protein